MLQKNQKRISDIVELLAAGLSYTKIAEIEAITRQRVQQLVKPPVNIINLIRERAACLCETCHAATGSHLHHKSWVKDTYNNPENLLLLCRECHQHLHAYSHHCIVCDTITSVAKRFCSTTCKKSYYTTSYRCEQCGILFTVPRSERPRRYCSKQCFGKWLGTHYGRPIGIGPRKWDEDTLIALHNIGYTRRMISSSLHMPFNTVKFYLTRYRKEHQKHTENK